MTETDRREFLKSTGAAIAGATGIGVLTSTSCDRQIRNPTRAELIKRLQKLAESKPTSELMHGASCYFTLPRIEKTVPCPDCGQTMTVGEKDEILRKYNVPLKRLQDMKVDAKLIIPEHCSACGFGLIEGKILVEIRYPDHPVPIRVEPGKPNFKSDFVLSRATELELMALFLQGKDRYSLGQQGDKALKDKVDRLRELFGVEDQ